MHHSRSLCRSAVLACMLSLAGVGILEAQQATGTVRGRVVAAKTMRPIGSAQVSIPGTGRGTVSNADGQFLVLNVPVGSHTIRAELIGFSAAERPVTVTADQVTTI